MGQESRRVETPQQEVTRLKEEIETVRSRLGTSVGELDRRRHELLDWRLQLKKHAGLVAGVGAGLVLAIAGAVAYGSRRERLMNLPSSRIRRIREALSTIVNEPEVVSKKKRAPSTISQRFLGAAAATAASMVAKRFVGQMMGTRAPAARRL